MAEAAETPFTMNFSFRFTVRRTVRVSRLLDQIEGTLIRNIKELDTSRTPWLRTAKTSLKYIFGRGEGFFKER